MSQETKPLTKIDNIKYLFGQIKTEDKDDFYERVANHFEMRKTSVRTGWFIRYEIPERYNVQNQLITFMQNYIRNKN